MPRHRGEVTPEVASFPQRLAEAMIFLNIDDRTLAERIGMNEGQIWRYRNGKHTDGVEANIIVRLAKTAIVRSSRWAKP